MEVLGPVVLFESVVKRIERRVKKSTSSCPCPPHPATLRTDEARTQLQENGGGVSAQEVGGHTLCTCLQQLWGHEDIQDTQDALRILVLFMGL